MVKMYVWGQLNQSIFLHNFVPELDFFIWCVKICPKYNFPEIILHKNVFLEHGNHRDRISQTGPKTRSGLLK